MSLPYRLHKPITRDVDFHMTSYISECMIYGVAGLFLGVIVNKSFKYFFPRTTIISIILQIFSLICVVYFLHRFVNEQFVDDFQCHVSGLFFVGMYFGTQTQIFNHF